MHASDQLVTAVHDGDINAVRRALAAGADVNYEDEDGDTPLMTASYLGQLDIVKLLIKRGADPNHWSQGDNPLRRAAAGGRRDVYEYLQHAVSDDTCQSADDKILRKGELQREREADPYVDEFIRNAAQGNLVEVKAAIASGAKLNSFNSNGCTALHYAAYYGQLPAVQMLLDSGANVDLRSEESGALGRGASALWIAAGSDYVRDHGEIIRALIAAGADVDAQDLDGQTPLMRAVDKGFSGYPGAIAALIEAGASLDIVDIKGRTAVDIAVLRERSDEIVKMVQTMQDEV
jgi:ankyrin repeat protein